MKVLHINCNYISTPLHQTMMNHLDNKAIDSVVFAPISRFTDFKIVPNSNVVAAKCFNKLDRYFFYHKQRKIRLSLLKNIDINGIDCIHAYTLFTDGYCAFRLQKKYNIPYIVAVRDTDVNVFLRKLIYLRKTGLRVLRNASKVVFLSETYKEQVLSKYVPVKFRDEINGKSLIIPNGIDDFWITNCNKSRDLLKNEAEFQNKIIDAIFIGVVNRRKNPSTTVKTLRILRERGWTVRFTVIGKIEDTREYNAIVQDKSVNYYPPMNMEELLNYYRSNSIFVMPSKTETFGLTYAEALSQGLPVIYSKGQGFDKQFPEGEVGYSVDPDSPMDIADKIERIIDNYKVIAVNCLADVDKFEWDSITEKYKVLYNEIVSSGK